MRADTRRQMERDAVAVCFPDWEWRDSDEVLIDCDNDPGYHYSSYTYESPAFKVRVEVRRKGFFNDGTYLPEDGSEAFSRFGQPSAEWDKYMRSTEHEGDDAAEFLNKLLTFDKEN